MKKSSASFPCFILLFSALACGEESSSEVDSGARVDSGQRIATLDSGFTSPEDSGSTSADAETSDEDSGFPVDAAADLDAGMATDAMMDATIFADASSIDAEPSDAGVPDAGNNPPDSGFADSGVSDSGTIIVDTGLQDSGTMDSGAPNPDAAIPDSGPVDSGAPSVMQSGQVVITEFVGRTNASEWIELLNTTNQDIDLSNYSIRFQSQGGQAFGFRSGLNPSVTSTTPIILASGGSKHFIANPANASDIPVGVDVYGPAGACAGDCFADTGDVIRLFEASNLVDIVDASIIATESDTVITDVQFPVVSEFSTQLTVDPTSTNRAQDNDDARQWCATIWRGPTPGTPNHDCNWAVISEILYDYDDISGGSDTGHEFVEIASAVGGSLSNVNVVSIQGSNSSAGAILGQYTVSASRMGGSGLFVIGDQSTAGQTEVSNANQIENLDFQNGPDAIQLIRAPSGGTAEYLDSIGYGSLTSNLVDQSRMLAVFEGTPVSDPSTVTRPFSWSRDEFQSDQNDNEQDFNFEPVPTPGKRNLTSILEITSVRPSNVLATDSATVTISGTDFTDFMTLEIGGQVIPSTQCQDLDRDVIQCLISFTSTLAFAPIDQNLSLTTRTEHGQTANFGQDFRWSLSVNETDDPLEVDYCNIQFPGNLITSASVASDPVYGRIFEGGITDTTSGESSLVIAELGYGPVTEDPRTSNEWNWLPASFNVEYGNDDEYQGVVTIDTPGTYNYTFRFSVDGGSRWTVCDLDGAGANPNLAYDASQIGTITVN